MHKIPIKKIKARTFLVEVELREFIEISRKKSTDFFFTYCIIFLDNTGFANPI